MQFNNFHKAYFNAVTGAFSRVTEREHYDSQITLTDLEADIVINYFGSENIQLGRVNLDREKSSKSFLLYPNLTPIHLNLVFPKVAKTELRLYLAASAQFKPVANNIWFIFINLNGQIVIGDLEERIWNSLGQEDIIDDYYQQEIEGSLIRPDVDNVDRNGRIVQVEIRGRKTFRRDPKLAVLRFSEAGYKCENNPLHETFIAESTKLPYVEAHHFIPIQFQSIFDFPLDNFNNIIALCPNCHRIIHHALIHHKYEMISNLYLKRPEVSVVGLHSIAELYNCLTIPQEQ